MAPKQQHAGAGKPGSQPGKKKGNVPVPVKQPVKVGSSGAAFTPAQGSVPAPETEFRRLKWTVSAVIATLGVIWPIVTLLIVKPQENRIAEMGRQLDDAKATIKDLKAEVQQLNDRLDAQLESRGLRSGVASWIDRSEIKGAPSPYSVDRNLLASSVTLGAQHAIGAALGSGLTSSNGGCCFNLGDLPRTWSGFWSERDPEAEAAIERFLGHGFMKELMRDHNLLKRLDAPVQLELGPDIVVQAENRPPEMPTPRKIN